MFAGAKNHWGGWVRIRIREQAGGDGGTGTRNLSTLLLEPRLPPILILLLLLRLLLWSCYSCCCCLCYC